MDVRFTVGEMASLYGISRQTLIFYDREGVFSPAYQDGQNGYRYYTPDQLEELDSIMILREMGFTLRQIRAHMANRTPETALELLNHQRQAVRTKIDRLHRIDRRISRKTESLSAFRETNGRMVIRRMEPQLLAVWPVEEPCGILEEDIALKSLFRGANAAQAEHFYQIGDIVAQKDVAEHRFLRFSHVFLPILQPCGGIETREKEAGDYAAIIHRGPYENTADTYLSLLDQIAESGLRPVGDAYEFCIFDHLTSGSPQDYRMEIQIRVLPQLPGEGKAEYFFEST